MQQDGLPFIGRESNPFVSRSCGPNPNQQRSAIAGGSSWNSDSDAGGQVTRLGYVSSSYG